VAWADLVEEEEPSLIDRLAVEVETKCGIKPDIDDLAAFLKGLRPTVSVATPPPPATTLPPRLQDPPAHRDIVPCGFELNGQSVLCRTAKDVMIGILRALAVSDSSFPDRCYHHPDNRGRVRTYIAKTTTELYPERPDLEEYSEEFVPGWFVATNVSNQVKDRIIRMACNVASLTPNVTIRYSL
jgi:hypothetical protein